MWMSDRRWMPLAGLLLSLMAPMAVADTIDTTFVNVSPRRDVYITDNGGSSVFHVFAGEMLFHRNSGVDLGGIGGLIQAFCVEIRQDVDFGGHYVYDLAPVAQVPNTSPMGATKADELSELWGRYFSIVVDNDSAAAFQLAVWEIVNDTQLDLHAGNFQTVLGPGQTTDGAYVALAQGWLNSLDGTGPKQHLVGLTNSDYQDQITTIPAPAAAWGGLALLAACIAAGIRKRLAL